MSGKQSTLFTGSNPSALRTTSDTLNVLQGLERGWVEPFAVQILKAIQPFCVRVELAGSIRRQKQVVNDIDIALQPALLPVDSWLQIIKLLRRDFRALTLKQGEKIAVLNVPFGDSLQRGFVQVDLYRAEPATWGILLLVRTGSKEHNVKLCNLAIQKGLHLQYSVGLTDKDGRVVAGRTEEEVFSALGLPFIPPEKREVESGGLE